MIKPTFVSLTVHGDGLAGLLNRETGKLIGVWQEQVPRPAPQDGLMPMYRVVLLKSIEAEETAGTGGDPT